MSKSGPNAEHMIPLALDRAESVTKEGLASAKATLNRMKDVRVTSGGTNELYQRTFELLKAGGLEAEIPRLVVFGQQSMGKTTLLDYIIGGPIGFSSTTTGTRMPVVISISPCRPPNNSLSIHLDGQVLSLDAIHESMEKIMTKQGDTISDREISLQIEMPDAAHAIFVDLPGIKDDSKFGAEMTRSVVQNYVQNNPNDLYILVKKASDDPANWPWSLREFILTGPPTGLGLARSQTIVVGTRAMEFLQNERSDVDDLGTLKKRIEARSIHDSSGRLIPIHLLELFSLPLDMKKGTEGFEVRKKEMNTQIATGQRRCNRLFKEFTLGKLTPTATSDLASVFDAQKFLGDLGSQFRSLLTNQMNSLCSRIDSRIRVVQADVQFIQRDIAVSGQLSVREAMRLFIRELLQVVTELVRGDYVIMRLDHNGDTFLNKFGGSLRDNLNDGESLATELFPQKMQYDPEFLTNLHEWSKSVHSQRVESEQRRIRLDSLSILDRIASESHGESSFQEPSPFPVPHLFPGQMVAMNLQKSKRALLLGFVEGLSDSQPVVHSPYPGGSSPEKHSNNRGSTNLAVTFFHQSSVDGRNASRPGSQQSTGSLHTLTSGREGGTRSPKLNTQSRSVESERLIVMIPLGLLIHGYEDRAKDCEKLAGLPIYRRTIRDDGWLGLEKGTLIAIDQLRVSLSSTASLDLFVSSTLRLSGGPVPMTSAMVVLACSDGKKVSVQVDDVFVASSMLRRGGAPQIHLSSYYLDFPQTDTDVAIAGHLANTKLLNQLSLTYLGRWLKYHINRLEPDKKFSLNILMQMMRSVRHVVDKADWEPLIADLLQANVRGGLLCLARLASCAAGVALRRIVRAGLAETERKVRDGLLSPGLLFLIRSPGFMDEIASGLEIFCQEKALKCSENMREMIFEQTHAVHFEMIEDFFEGCRDFESEFLPVSQTRGMEDVLDRVKSTLHARKERLGTADIYARQVNPNERAEGDSANEELIYEEVRVQFWIVKQLLSAPLTTKLYMHFVKDIKDRSSHLAAEGRYQNSSESDLEVALQQALLFNPDGLPRDDQALIQHFALDVENEQLLKQQQEKKRLLEFLKVIKHGTSLLLSAIQAGENVDFLSHLHAPKPPSNVASGDTVVRDQALTTGPSTKGQSKQTNNGLAAYSPTMLTSVGDQTQGVVGTTSQPRETVVEN